MDIEKLLNELSKLLSDISDTPRGRRMVVNSSRSRIMGFDISSNISIKIGLSEELKNTQVERYPQLTDVEPLIDVFDNEDGLKIVVLLPGIKKEDVTVTVMDGKLVIEIRKEFQVYRKEIPCNIRVDEIAVKTISNNSVIEMFLARKKVNVGE